MNTTDQTAALIAEWDRCRAATYRQARAAGDALAAALAAEKERADAMMREAAKVSLELHAAEALVVELRAERHRLLTENDTAFFPQLLAAEALVVELREKALALYEQVEMAESVGICLPDRVPSLRLAEALARAAGETAP